MGSKTHAVENIIPSSAELSSDRIGPAQEIIHAQNSTTSTIPTDENESGQADAKDLELYPHQYPPLTTPMKEEEIAKDERMNPHHYPLALDETGAAGARRTPSISPDRATGYCDPRPPDAGGISGVGAKVEVELSQTRKYVLLTVFSLGVFIDGEFQERCRDHIAMDNAHKAVLGVCVFYILNPAVAEDLGIKFEAQTWIIVSFVPSFRVPSSTGQSLHHRLRRSPLTHTDILRDPLRRLSPLLGPSLGSLLAHNGL